MRVFIRRYLLPVFVLALCAAAVASAAVIKGQPTARSNGSSITVHWDSDDETGIIGYEIARKVGWDGQYVVLVPSYRAKGSNQPYDFVDDSAFRTSGTYYEYRITALYGSGARSDPYEVGVSHNTTGVKKTWGSIKAMFR